MNRSAYYQKLYKLFNKAGGTLSVFCRKRNLPYDSVRKAFLRLRKSEKVRDIKHQSRGSPAKLKDPATVDVPEICQKKGKNLTQRQKALLVQEVTTIGKTNAAMAKDAGYTAKNLSKAFIAARQSENYQETLARSKIELQRKIGIQGEYLLRRLIEIGLSRPRDILQLDNGEITIRNDIDFTEGADLAIKNISVTLVEITSKNRSSVKKELRFEAADSIRALIAAIKIGGYFDDSVYNSIVGGNEEVQELWKQFKVQEISANDFSMELAMRGLAVPKSLEIQAKAELAAMVKGGIDDGLDEINLMDYYDEILEDEAIEKKKREVEAERKREQALREKELADLNEEDDDDMNCFS